MSDQLYIGLISGTSVDSIDAVLVGFKKNKPDIIHSLSYPIPEDIKQEVITLCSPGDNEIQRMASVDNKIAELFADAALQLLKISTYSAEHITAIGSHGQTIRHYPPVSTQHIAFSLQIGNPNIIAEKTGITTVADFRRRDMAVGGQGAPLVPAFHAAIFEDISENCVIANLGGIANITLLSPDKTKISGFDTGPGNGLMDAWARYAFQCDYDRDGAIAAQGNAHPTLLDALLCDTYFKLEPPKSTGREHFNIAWLLQHLEAFPGASKEDVMATLSKLTARTIAQAIKDYSPSTNHVLICGGGAHNKTLVQALQSQLDPIKTEASSAIGINPDFVEATAFAWLAKQTLEHKPGNLPKVTGANKPVILGGIYLSQ